MLTNGVSSEPAVGAALFANKHTATRTPPSPNGDQLSR